MEKRRLGRTDCSFPLALTNKDDIDLTRENATYNWPWVKTGFSKRTPTLSKVCPCDLLMVIAKHNRTGNCSRRIVKGNISPVDSNLILGMRAICPKKDPVKISHFKIVEEISSTRSRVPLQSPFLVSRFLSNITITPTFSNSLWGGKPLGVSEFRNSRGYSDGSSPSSQITSSMLFETVRVPRIFSTKRSLIELTWSLVEHKMTFFQINSKFGPSIVVPKIASSKFPVTIFDSGTLIFPSLSLAVPFPIVKTYLFNLWD